MVFCLDLVKQHSDRDRSSLVFLNGVALDMATLKLLPLLSTLLYTTHTLWLF